MASSAEGIGALFVLKFGPTTHGESASQRVFFHFYHHRSGPEFSMYSAQ